MAQTWSSVVVVAMLYCMGVMRRASAATLTDCSTVTSDLSDCFAYLTRGGPPPPPASPCCSGVNSIYNLASTRDARQQICSCLKTVAAQTSNLNSQAIQNLPSACGIDLGFPITPDIDCSRIN